MQLYSKTLEKYKQLRYLVEHFGITELLENILYVIFQLTVSKKKTEI